MTQLPFDPYESSSEPRRRRAAAGRNPQETDVWVLQTQLKSELLGWLFYAGGTARSSWRC